jgi:predicted ATPase
MPDFVVLTGVNGSGKSHLLEAIDKKHVAVQGIDNPHIVLFNYETFRLDNEPEFNAHQLSAERESAWQYYQSHIKPQATSWRSGLGSSYTDLRTSCTSERKSLWSLGLDALRPYKQQIKTYFTRQKMRENQQAQGIYSLTKTLPYSLDEIVHDDFVRLYKPFTFKNDFLPHQLGKVFWDYYVKYRGNQVNEFQNATYGKKYDALSEKEFVATHGEKPWDLVNEVLRTFDTLKYKVTSPEGSDYFGNFQLKLKHTEHPNLEIDFSHLSSGERVLMALVASVYKSSTDRHFPDLLLLDEVDASLHPSMMKNMLEVIERIFLSHGVKVILVTHSPTTLALAPESSVYVMNRAGPARIEKKSRRDALSILTQGFATIEEGHNSRLIEKALQLYGVTGVDVLSGVEGASGKNQLRTLFQFFARARHDKRVIFVWDCDGSQTVTETNNTFPFVIPKNPGNTIAKDGIENAFPEQLFTGFTKTITRSNGAMLTEFDEARKRDFEGFVLGRSRQDDFSHFASLIDEVRRVQNLP